MHMKKILVFASLFLLTACSNASVDSTQLYEDIKNRFYDEEMIEVDASLAKNLLFLEDEKSVCQGLTSSSEVVSEFMICEKNDEIEEKLKARITYYKDSAEKYRTEDVSMIEKSQLMECGSSLILIIGENASEIASYIQENY